MWGQAQAQLQEAVKGERGRPKADKSARCAELTNDPTVGTHGKPTDRKSRLIRTLTNLKDDLPGKAVTRRRVCQWCQSLTASIPAETCPNPSQAGIRVQNQPQIVSKLLISARLARWCASWPGTS